MYGPDARLQFGRLSFSVHVPFGMAGSSKLGFATMFARADRVLSERNNADKKRYLRINPPISLFGRAPNITAGFWARKRSSTGTFEHDLRARRQRKTRRNEVQAALGWTSREACPTVWREAERGR